jgi:hypothetical protein
MGCIWFGLREQVNQNVGAGCGVDDEWMERRGEKKNNKEWAGGALLLRAEIVSAGKEGSLPSWEERLPLQSKTARVCGEQDVPNEESTQGLKRRLVTRQPAWATHESGEDSSRTGVRNQIPFS